MGLQACTYYTGTILDFTVSMWDGTPATKYNYRKKLNFNMKKGQKPLQWDILDQFLIFNMSTRIISR